MKHFYINSDILNREKNGFRVKEFDVIFPQKLVQNLLRTTLNMIKTCVSVIAKRGVIINTGLILRVLSCKNSRYHLSNMQGENLYHNGTASPEKKYTVAVEGNIASGKTTLLRYFSKFQDALVYQEPVDRWRNVKGHNLLGLMYNDPSRWSLAFQTYVQLTMIDVHKRELPNDKKVKLIERSLFSAKYCFVENLFQSGRMTEVENVILSEWFEWLVANENPHLDLIVYLRTTPEVSWKRIQERHRPEEATIPLEYLKHLHDLHEDWLIKRRRFSVPCPVLVIDANCELDEMEPIFEKHSDEILCNNGRPPKLSSVASANTLIT